jgi:hypothetical protein
MVPTMSPMMVLVAVLSAASVMMLQLALMLALEETLAALTAASVVVSMLETSVLTTVVVTVVSLLTPMTRLRRGKCNREHCSRLDLPFPRPHHKSASSASFARHASHGCAFAKSTPVSGLSVCGNDLRAQEITTRWFGFMLLMKSVPPTLL